MSEEEIERETAEQRAEETFEYYEENKESVTLFLLLTTQWRVAIGDKPVWMGMDYSAILSTMLLLRVPRARHGALFLDLRLMEHAAIEVLNEKKDGDGR